MKQSIVRITIVTLVIVGLLMVGYGLTVKPTAEVQAVGNGHAESVSFARDTQSRYAMQNDVTASLIGDCLSDRVTGDLYPQPDPYCLPVPSVAVVERAKEREQDTSVIVDVPATPEPPAVEPPVVEPEQPVITPEVPSTPEPSNAGNPGNTKNVGNAGENPNGRGTMDNDNAGGNGNGQHGNQGEGGHNN
jgi:hypothetical protein